jgi:CMP-N-acetylneuraminic acid synthetase
MTTIATICARGGSQGVPGKNIRDLLGKPLIVHTIEQALGHPALERVFVSTDSEAIAEVARRAGAEVPFLRPAELATHAAPKLPVIGHLLGWIEANGIAVERIVDLDPTSPLRSLDDITACLALLDENCDTVITGYPAEKSPYFNLVEVQPDGNVRLSKPPPNELYARQSAPTVYAMNGSVYAWHRRSFDKRLWGGRTRLHAMPRERSIDIDSELDFMLVELLLRRRAGA